MDSIVEVVGQPRDCCDLSRLKSTGGLLLALGCIFSILNLPTICAGQDSISEGQSQIDTYAPSLEFDVASIRESAPAASYSQYLSNPAHIGTFDAVDLWMNQVVAAAFDVNWRYQLVGGPDWMAQQRFTIHAKSDPSVDDRLARLSDGQAEREKQHMLLALLKDRFGFEGHVETRDGTVYLLKVAKPSPNFQEATGSEDASNLPGKSFGIITGGSLSNLVLTGRQASMQQLAGMMSFYLKTQVLDQTGLSKKYNFVVHFNAKGDDLQSEGVEEPPPAEVAFPQQIGLKLVRGRGPVKTVVVKALKRPSPN